MFSFAGACDGADTEKLIEDRMAVGLWVKKLQCPHFLRRSLSSYQSVDGREPVGSDAERTVW